MGKKKVKKAEKVCTALLNEMKANDGKLSTKTIDNLERTDRRILTLIVMASMMAVNQSQLRAAELLKTAASSVKH